MIRALRVGVWVVAGLLGISLLLLVIGLIMAARPEAFASLGVGDTSKTGMVLALAGGVTAIASAVVGRVLDLLRGALSDQDGSSVR